MGILKLFNFNGRSNTDQENDDIMQTNGSAKEVERDLFVDSNIPEHSPVTVQTGNALMSFLNTDFYSIGYNDGYDNHSETAFRESQIRIVQGFMFAVETVISQRKEFICSLRKHIRNIGNSSVTDTLIAEDKIHEVKLVIQELESQKSLAFNNGLPPVAGLVMKPITQYRSGYINGLKAYSEEKFFASSTGLFN